MYVVKTDSGIMKFVGDARAKYNPTAPLIGIVPIGSGINATRSLRDLAYTRSCIKHGDSEDGDKECCWEYKSPVPDGELRGESSSETSPPQEPRTWRFRGSDSSWRHLAASDGGSEMRGAQLSISTIVEWEERLHQNAVNAQENQVRVREKLVYPHINLIAREPAT